MASNFFKESRALKKKHVSYLHINMSVHLKSIIIVSPDGSKAIDYTKSDHDLPYDIYSVHSHDYRGFPGYSNNSQCRISFNIEPSGRGYLRITEDSRQFDIMVKPDYFSKSAFGHYKSLTVYTNLYDGGESWQVEIVFVIVEKHHE